MCTHVTRSVVIGFGSTSDWLIKWRMIFSHKQSVAMQNQNNHEIAFDTQLKTVLAIMPLQYYVVVVFLVPQLFSISFIVSFLSFL